MIFCDDAMTDRSNDDVAPCVPQLESQFDFDGSGFNVLESVCNQNRMRTGNHVAAFRNNRVNAFVRTYPAPG